MLCRIIKKKLACQKLCKQLFFFFLFLRCSAAARKVFMSQGFLHSSQSNSQDAPPAEAAATRCTDQPSGPSPAQGMAEGPCSEEGQQGLSLYLYPSCSIWGQGSLFLPIDLFLMAHLT